MNQISKGLLTGAIVVTFGLVVLGIEALRNTRRGLLLRMVAWTLFVALVLISLQLAHAHDAGQWGDSERRCATGTRA